MMYLLRDIPPTFWRQVRKRAKLEGRPIRYILMQLLQRYVKQGLK